MRSILSPNAPKKSFDKGQAKQACRLPFWVTLPSLAAASAPFLLEARRCWLLLPLQVLAVWLLLLLLLLLLKTRSLRCLAPCLEHLAQKAPLFPSMRTDGIYKVRVCDCVCWWRCCCLLEMRKKKSSASKHVSQQSASSRKNKQRN